MMVNKFPLNIAAVALSFGFEYSANDFENERHVGSTIIIIFYELADNVQQKTHVFLALQSNLESLTKICWFVLHNPAKKFQ